MSFLIGMFIGLVIGAGIGALIMGIIASGKMQSYEERLASKQSLLDAIHGYNWETLKRDKLHGLAYSDDVKEKP